MTRTGLLSRVARPLGVDATVKTAEAPRRSKLPPGQRAAAMVLVGWSLAFPLALVALLGPEPASDTAVDKPASRHAIAPETLDAILQRPLFSRSRRPPAPMMPPAPMQPAAPQRDRQLVVRGIVIRDDGAKAFITAAAAPQGTWVGIGDAIGGWKVAAIRPRDVELKDGTETFVAPMSATGGP